MYILITSRIRLGWRHWKSVKVCERRLTADVKWLRQLVTRRFVIWVVFSYGAFFYIGRFVVHDVFSFGTFRGKFPYKCAVGGWERIFWLSSLTSQTCWIWTIGIIKKCLSGCHTQRQHGGEYIYNIKCDIPHFPPICMLVCSYDIDF